MAEKLKPCPFCGGEAELVNIGAKLCDPITVACKQCKCNTQWFDRECDAIKAWNRRTSNERDFVQRKEKRYRRMGERFCLERSRYYNYNT